MPMTAEEIWARMTPTPDKQDILLALSKHGQMHSSEIETIVKLSRQSVWDKLLQLEHEGLVWKKEDPAVVIFQGKKCYQRYIYGVVSK